MRRVFSFDDWISRESIVKMEIEDKIRKEYIDPGQEHTMAPRSI